MQYSNKREKTKRSIINAFMDLSGSRDISQITVRSLCESAEINRSTFYTYYTDVYELRDMVAKELVTDLAGRIFTEDRKIKDMDINAIVRTLAEFLEEREWKPLILLKANTNLFVNMISGELQKRMGDMGLQLTGNQESDLQLYARYHINGVIAVLSTLDEDSAPKDIDIVIGKIARLANEGVLTVIKKELGKMQ
ncbi:MAG: hypothetical protein Q4A40_04825 [Bacillota bacterium]|nr:hypothetical protein [Bacillota bacterium]